MKLSAMPNFGHLCLLSTLGVGVSLAAPGLTSAIKRDGGTIACDQVPAPEVPGTEILSVVGVERLGVSGLGGRDRAGQPSNLTDLNFCSVNVTLTHPGVNDTVSFEIWLPLTGWNGRFYGSGGGGWSGGTYDLAGLGVPVANGWAAGTTDGSRTSLDIGLTINPNILSADGKVDRGRWVDFASRAPHELAIIGKAVTTSFYGTKPHRSYFVGCSGGGRQGYMLAQRYPHDYDGYLANAPALYWPSFFTSMNWGNTLARVEDHWPSRCALKAAFEAATASCDPLDGVVDGVIANLADCQFDPAVLVGTQINCTDADGQNTTETFSAQDAKVLTALHKGPVSPLGTKLWEALPWGIDYIAAFQPEDQPGFGPFWSAWIKYFVKKDANYDINSLDSLEEYTDIFATSNSEWDGIIGTDMPDLSALRDAGGKLLTWHGSADGHIQLDTTIRYRKTVEDVMGGNALVNDFYRFFEAPGVGHCSDGNGAYPSDALDSLISWVEDGEAPEELHGEMVTPKGETATRKMCLWPLVARFDGQGDENDAESYSCVESFGVSDGGCKRSI